MSKHFNFRKVEPFRWWSCMRKKAFSSESKAEKMARQIGQTKYLCQFCGQWHLTKKKPV